MYHHSSEHMHGQLETLADDRRGSKEGWQDWSEEGMHAVRVAHHAEVVQANPRVNNAKEVRHG